MKVAVKPAKKTNPVSAPAVGRLPVRMEQNRLASEMVTGGQDVRLFTGVSCDGGHAAAGVGGGAGTR